MRSRGEGGRTARECALSLLEYGDRTEWELRQKLRERGYGEEEAEEAMAFLQSYHYVDDEAYVQRYIRSFSRKKSLRQICRDLRQRGVDRRVVEDCAAAQEVDETVPIRAFLEKKGWFSGEPHMPEERKKLTAALCRRGFSLETIREVMEQAQEEQ